MFRNLFIAAGAAALLVSSVGIAKAAPVATSSFGLEGSSSAAAFNFTLTGVGSPIKLTNQVYASGTAAPGTYSKTTTVPSFSLNKTYGSGAASIAVKGSAKTVTSSASSAGLTKAGALTVSAKSTTSSFTATLTNPLLGKALTVTGTNITSNASNAGTKAGKTTATGSAKIGKITFNSPLFGIKNASYTGTPKPNKILYHNKDNSVMLIANHQVRRRGQTKHSPSMRSH